MIYICSWCENVLTGTCGVGRSSFGSLDVIRDNGSILCFVHRPSATTQDVGSDTLSPVIHPCPDNMDGLASSFFTEQDMADKLDGTSVQHDNAMSRHSSAAVDLNCSVMNTVSRNRITKVTLMAARRMSLNEAVMTHFSAAGMYDGGCISSAEQCQRAVWKRTMSYDMSAHEVTVL